MNRKSKNSFYWAYLISEIVGNSAPVSFPLIAISVFQASTKEVSFIMILSSLPWLFAAHIGSAIDKLSNKTVLYSVEMFRAIAFMAMAYIIQMGFSTIIAFYIFVITTTILKIFYDTCSQSSLFFLNDGNNIKERNSKYESYRALSMVFGPIFGGVILGFLVEVNFLYFAGVLYLSSAYLLSFTVYTQKTEIKKSAIQTKNQYLFLSLWNNKILKIQFIFTSFLGLVIYLPMIYLVPFLKMDLKFQEITLGLVFSLIGVGTLIGAKLFRKIKNDKLVLSQSISIVVIAVALYIFSGSISLAPGLSFVGAFLFGIGIAINGATSRLIRHENVESEDQAKASGFILLSAQLSIPISASFGAWIITYINISTLFTIGGILILSLAFPYYKFMDKALQMSTENRT